MEIAYKLPVRNVWIDYDKEADVLYLSFRRPQRAKKTVEAGDDILVRTDENEGVPHPLMRNNFSPSAMNPTNPMNLLSVPNPLILILITHELRAMSHLVGSTGTGVVNHPLFVNYSLFYR